MTEIFLSYAQEDERRLRPLVKTLHKKDWTVFWDRFIPPGQHYRSRIAPVLEAARCVLVVWSSESVRSESVIEEAGEGRRRGCLVPVRLDRVDPPFGFREIQYADFSDSGFARSSPRLLELLNAISAVLRAPTAKPVAEPEGKIPKQSRRSPTTPRKRAKTTAGHLVKVGEVRLPKSDPSAPKFWDGSKGPREVSVPVRFDAPFARAPKVIVGLREFDLDDAKANIHRISVRAENVGRHGFDMFFATWLESKVYGAVASWIAVGDRE